MIPSGVKVFLASHPVDFRKVSMALLRLCAMRARIRSTVRFMSSEPKEPTE